MKKVNCHALADGHPFFASAWIPAFAGRTSLFPCILSAVLLILAYPKFDFWFFAWIGLVPFLFAIDGKTNAQAFKIGYFFGLLFFTGTLYWFIYMASTGGIPLFLSVLALGLLVMYLALYFGLFALFYNLLRRKSNSANLFLMPSLWIVMEFFRDRLFSGFGWVSLGHSQYKQIPIIQIADLTGVFGVSFLIVMVNFLIKEILKTTFGTRKRKLRGIVPSCVIVLLVIASALFYGFYRMKDFYSSTRESINIAIVQANIGQGQKWDRTFWPVIMNKHLALTEEAVKEKPDLIIWPETSFPGYLWTAPGDFEELKRFVARIHIPLLLGAVTKDNDDFYNSAILISKEGEELVKYDKRHLVPFGEYLPLRKQMPFLSSLVPVEDFSSGRKATVFPAFAVEGQKEKDLSFSVLICFEDTVTWVSRTMAKAGAQFFVNMTNDAWFLDTKEPFLHLQGAIFQAVQNRRSLVRAANTGVSCFINSLGDITRSVKNKSGKKTYIAGTAVDRVVFSKKIPFYTKFGDVFTYFCFGCILIATIMKMCIPSNKIGNI